FDESQRKATQNAGQLAGLEVVRIINEPTAAALAYEAGHSDDEHILVYDLGGGTFDVSVVVVEAGVVEVKASHGDTHLGGDDFDQLLVQRVVDAFHEKHGIFLNEDPKTLRRLKVVLERAKIRLSDEPFVKIHEEYIHGDLHLETEIQRLDYEVMIEPYLQKTLDCIHQSLQDARLLPRDIAKVMLVGGSTRTPLVHSLIEEKLGITPRWEINPDLIVAMGASISGAALAGEKSKAILVDITNHSFGIEVIESEFMGDRLKYAPIIHRNTPLPVSRSELFTTYVDNQTRVEIKVYQGEDPDAANNTLVGEFHVEGLSKVPRGNPVVVHFSLDLNGMLKVTASEKITGHSKTVTLDTRQAAVALDMSQARRNIEALMGEMLEDTGDEEEKPLLETGGEHHALLATAKDLRKRSEALLGSGIGEEDATEITNLLKQSADAVKAQDWEKLGELNESLSDLVYYLED
ncbi:MAG: heat-shock protein Hsp70, partial [Verrucomicrobiaceae bacterium]